MNAVESQFMRIYKLDLVDLLQPCIWKTFERVYTAGLCSLSVQFDYQTEDSNDLDYEDK